MRKAIFCAVLSVTVVLAMLAQVRAGEVKLAVDQLPKAVLDAAKAKFADAKIIGAGKEDEDGKVVYEVTLENLGHKLDVTFTPDGKLVSIEKTISAKELPKPVAKALRKRYPKSSVKKIEEITKEDKITAYEALVVTRDKATVEVAFDPSGKFLREEKKEHEAKEKVEK